MSIFAHRYLSKKIITIIFTNIKNLKTNNYEVQTFTLLAASVNHDNRR